MSALLEFIGAVAILGGVFAAGVLVGVRVASRNVAKMVFEAIEKQAAVIAGDLYAVVLLQRDVPKDFVVEDAQVRVEQAPNPNPNRKDLH